MSNDVSEVFTRFVLDPVFREAFCRDPEGTLQEYTLTPQERTLLLKADHGSIELLGRALAQSGITHAESIVEAPSTDPETDAGMAHAVPLPAIHFLITIQPQAIQNADGSIQISHSAFAKPIEMPPTLDLSAASTTQPPIKAQLPENTLSPSPWEHKTHTAEAKQAAKAVHEASPEDRYDRLLALISTLQGNTHRDPNN